MTILRNGRTMFMRVMGGTREAQSKENIIPRLLGD
jgi:hypothetical protein